MSVASWYSRVERTQVSTVIGLSLSQAQESTVAHGLQIMLHVVQELGIPRYLPHQLGASAVLAEGETFSVRRSRLRNTTVAIKHVKLDTADPRFSRAILSRRLQSVLREICIMRHESLEQHPNILNIIGYGWIERPELAAPFLIVEYGKYGSVRRWLQGHLKVHQPWVVQRWIYICREVARGLAALHESGVIHGDLKLDNIIACEEITAPHRIRPKISDFGHSIIVDATRPITNYYGSMLYNAPEVHMQEQICIPHAHLKKCDIWAMGLLIWETFLGGNTYLKSEWCITGVDTSTRSFASTTQPAATGASSAWADVFSKCFGKFDLRLVRVLATAHVKYVLRTTKSDQETEIIEILSDMLEFEAEHRLDSLRNSKLLGLEGRSSVGQHEPKTTVAMRPDAFKLSSDLFFWKHSKHSSWFLEQEIYRDLDSAYQSAVDKDTSSNAAFQVALCHIDGFGCKQDLLLARQWVDRAKTKGHPIAAFLESQLSLHLSGSGSGYPKFVTNLRRDKHNVVFYDFDSDDSSAGSSSLLRACEKGDIEAVIVGLRNGAKLQDESGLSVFHWLACIEDHLEQVRALLQSYPKDAIRLAIDLECLDYRTAHPQIPVKLGGTPLAFAVLLGSPKVVEFLLSLGANADICCLNRSTADVGNESTERAEMRVVDLAVQLHDSVSVDLLLDVCCFSPLQISTSLSNGSAVQRFFRHGSSSNDALHQTLKVLENRCTQLFEVHDEFRLQCLKHALRADDEAVVWELLSEFPDLARTRDKTGLYPIHWLAEVASDHPSHSSTNLLKLLCSKGASVFTKDHNGATALHYAARGRYDNASRHLLEASKLLQSSESLETQCDENGQLPIHQVNHPDVLRYLVDYNDTLDATDNKGQTLAHVACSQGNDILVSSLLEIGADMTAIDHSGQTPRACARGNGYEGTELILEAGGILEQAAGLLSLLVDNTNIKHMRREKIAHRKTGPRMIKNQESNRPFWESHFQGTFDPAFAHHYGVSKFGSRSSPWQRETERNQKRSHISRNTPRDIPSPRENEAERRFDRLSIAPQLDGSYTSRASLAAYDFATYPRRIVTNPRILRPPLRHEPQCSEMNPRRSTDITVAISPPNRHIFSQGIAPSRVRIRPSNPQTGINRASENDVTRHMRTGF